MKVGRELNAQGGAVVRLNTLTDNLHQLLEAVNDSLIGFARSGAGGAGQSLVRSLRCRVARAPGLLGPGRTDLLKLGKSEQDDRPDDPGKAGLMQSPFPGMDPYLEGSSWMNVHSLFGAEIVHDLSPKLRPKYQAVLNEWFIIEDPEDVAVSTSRGSPDVGVVEAKGAEFLGPESGVATAPLLLATVMPQTIRHLTVEIRDRAERELVTAIEVLSPTNKHGEGRKDYLTKRRRVLFSTAHLLEIDLLRAGRRVPMTRPLPPVPYFIFLSRAERRPMTEVWPVRLDQPLPVVPVPLLPGDADVPLDLQRIWSKIYDSCAFDMAVDYSQSPEVPLNPEDAAWADERLRAAGLRR